MQLLQDDLDQLQLWENEWDMEFHPQKCEHITFLRKRHPNSDKLKLHKTDIPRADSIKYLGVTLDPKLIWHSHVNKTAAKANSTLGFIRRNVLTKSQDVKKTAAAGASCTRVCVLCMGLCSR